MPEWSIPWLVAINLAALGLACWFLLRLLGRDRPGDREMLTRTMTVLLFSLACLALLFGTADAGSPLWDRLTPMPVCRCLLPGEPAPLFDRNCPYPRPDCDTPTPTPEPTSTPWPTETATPEPTVVPTVVIWLPNAWRQ